MAKLNVAQQDGEIVFTPGGIKPRRTYKVAKGVIDVDDDDLAEVAQSLAQGAISPGAAEQVAYDQAKADQAAKDNTKAVASATAAGAARAAAEISKPAK